MSEELFSVPESKSPKLRWMERHGLRTKHNPDSQHGDEDDFGNELFRWYAWKYEGKLNPPRNAAGGDTEDDALAAWAVANGKLLWNEEGACS